MMTDPTNHRLAGQSWLENAIDWYGQIDDSDPWEKATASAWIAGAFFLAGEERHQSVKFEAAELFPHRLPMAWPAGLGPGELVELDEDNPDTLAEDDTVESPRFHGIAYIDDNGAGYEPVSAAAIHRHDHPGRTDFYGTPGPWDAA